LTAFILGRLDDKASEVIERHLAACAVCRDLLRVPAEDSLVALICGAGDSRISPSSTSILAAPSVRPVPGYELLETLGTGGMGVVWKARQKNLPRLVALKRLRAGGPLSEDLLVRFRREAEAVARLQHPNIVQIHEVGEQDGEPFLVLEYVAGGSLAQKLADGPLPPDAAAALVESLARAIHFAHEQGIIHRDLKPANVLLTADGTPKVSDFGLAKLLGASEASATQTGAILGTPSYMAPEQARGEATVGIAADVYALGAILYETLIGRPPFRGPSALETLAQVRDNDPVPPRTLQPQVPRDLETICLKCLHKEPGRRYTSAAALADDLRRFTVGGAIHARPVGWLERLRKWVRRKPALALLLGLLALAIAGAIGGAGWHEHRLRQEVVRAEDAESRSRQQYREARTLSKSILGRLTDMKKAHLPRERELLGGVLDDALAFYRAALENNASSAPEVRADTAQTLCQIGELQAFLGQQANAIDSFRKSARLYEQLTADVPEQLDYLRDLSQCYNALGCSTPPEEAFAWHEKALALREELARRQPENLAYAANVAHTHQNLGAYLQNLNQSRRAEEHYEQVISIAKKALAEQPGDINCRGLLAQSYNNLAILYHHTERADARFAVRRRQANEFYRDAESLLVALLAEYPGRTHLHYVLAAARLNWGNLLLETEGFDSALKVYGRGIAAIEEVLHEEPSFSAARETALNLHGARAQAYESRSRFAEALKDWDRAIELAQGPKRQTLSLHRAATLVRVGDHLRAAAEAESLAAEPDCTPDMRYDIACVFALAHAATLADAALPTTERAQRAEPHARRAVAVLEQLTRDGYFREKEHANNLRTDPDFNSLRQRADFLILLGERTRREATSK
jgi:tetratricopeptide (TPR) repeat protein